MKNILTTIAVTVMIFLATMEIVIAGTDRQEISECYSWQQEAQQYPDFYLTHWQNEQCIAHGITINARVQD